jgi:hypothetical protein
MTKSLIFLFWPSSFRVTSDVMEEELRFYDVTDSRLAERFYEDLDLGIDDAM